MRCFLVLICPERRDIDGICVSIGSLNVTAVPKDTFRSLMTVGDALESDQG